MLEFLPHNITSILQHLVLILEVNSYGRGFIEGPVFLHDLLVIGDLNGVDDVLPLILPEVLHDQANIVLDIHVFYLIPHLACCLEVVKGDLDG